MRVAIVGCGKISTAHIMALRQIEGLEICALCDTNEYRAKDLTEIAGTNAIYPDFGALLENEAPDVAHILTPPATHSELAIQGLEARSHILVEKPMALSVEDSDAMIEAAHKNERKLCVNHNYLFKPSIQRARDLIKAGAIGEVIYINSYYGLAGEGGAYGGKAGSHWAWKLPGGIFTNFIPHLIYLHQEMQGSINSIGGVSLSRLHADAPISELVVLLQGDNSSGVMGISMQTRPYAKFVDIYGTNGIIHADLVREVCTTNRVWGLPRMLSKVVFNVEDSVQLAAGTLRNSFEVALGRLPNMPGMHILLDRFYRSILSGDEDPPVSGEAGRDVVQVMQMIWEKSGGFSIAVTSKPPRKADPQPKTKVETEIASKRLLSHKVLVTGASGYLGGYLASALGRVGAEVTSLVRDPNAVSTELESNSRIVYGDLRDQSAIEAAMDGADLVFHCAAITTNKIPWRLHEEVNISGSELIFRQALKANVRRLIHVSSVMIYGMRPLPSKVPFVESDPYPQRPDKWAYYMRSKIEAEKRAMEYWESEHLPIAIMRLGILYGPEGGPLPATPLVRFGGLGITIGLGRNFMPYTYMDNAIDALLLAALSPEAEGQAFNIVDEPPITRRKALVDISRLSGERIFLLPVPALLFSGMASFLEVQRAIQGAEKPPAISRHLIRGACRNIRYDTLKARRHLCWQPEVPFEEGVRRCLVGMN
jgi:predicted dehydrogenase/nucleoside-diphosphate-sugar epimerase